MARKAAARNSYPIIHTVLYGRYANLVEFALIKQAVQATLKQQGVTPRVELGVIVTGNVQIRRLNRTYRHIDEPTDVLSFDTDFVRPDGVRGLGDVIICYPKAKEQAKAGGHPIEAEVQLLIVHGVLHLLGHDHYTRAEKAKMWRAQAAILRSIGAAITEPKG